ncbi:MAG: pyridoxamine kinase [Lachnospiraceae bacterium]|nr:pyridoxamine kinase [Lachnospiraceae bacterium]
MQTTTETIKKAGIPPRLAMFNSMAGFGRISTFVALPIISTMQVQVCPVPTSVLSNHLDFPTCFREDFTPHMQSYVQAWKELGLTFDGLYCGFFGKVEQMDIVEDFLQSFQPDTFLLDPVMGDNGKAYSTITPAHCERLKNLLHYADILTPNITEACLLTDTPYKDGPWTEYELDSICEKLTQLCPGRIVITGLHNNNSFLNYIWDNGQRSTYITAKSGRSRHGTGDMFASILIADALHKADFAASVKKAADFISLCIRGSEELNVPIKEGVIFENYLSTLIR